MDCQYRNTKYFLFLTPIDNLISQNIPFEEGRVGGDLCTTHIFIQLA